METYGITSLAAIQFANVDMSIKKYHLGFGNIDLLVVKKREALFVGFLEVLSFILRGKQNAVHLFTSTFINKDLSKIHI